MTGFGKAEQKTPLGTFTVEISSVNNRFLESSVRLPRQFSAVEHRVRELLGKYVNRGKLYVFVGFAESDESPDKYAINVRAATAYAKQLQALRNDLGLGGDVTIGDLLAFPEVVKSDEDSYDDEEIWAQLSPVLEVALKGLAAMRRREGEAMARDMDQRLKEITTVTRSVEAEAGQMVERYRERLKTRIAEISDAIEVDPNRLEQEVALQADRSDITEECTRMYSHIEQYDADLRRDEPVGKRLNFILQEMNREANTIASKCTEAAITRSVISLKEEIEKLRELVQNVE